MTGGGQMVTFEIDGGKAEAFRMQNAFEVISISNNLGDPRASSPIQRRRRTSD